MSGPPSLSDLLRQRHNHILGSLTDAASFISHPTEKGDATERVWLEALRTYLPVRYEARRGFAIDSLSNYSLQIDIIIHDRFYTPFLLEVGGYSVIPIESVYAGFEVKQSLNSKHIVQAQEKSASLRNLHRAYRPTKEVPEVGGKHLITGILATRSDFAGGLAGAAVEHMRSAKEPERLDYVCVAETGFGKFDEGNISVESSGSWITSFVLTLIEALQNLGTVSPIDVDRYRLAAST